VTTEVTISVDQVVVKTDSNDLRHVVKQARALWEATRTAQRAGPGYGYGGSMAPTNGRRRRLGEGAQIEVAP
jgi:hypothetical protein